jgi:hypothetical protein
MRSIPGATGRFLRREGRDSEVCSCVFRFSGGCKERMIPVGARAGRVGGGVLVVGFDAVDLRMQALSEFAGRMRTLGFSYATYTPLSIFVNGTRVAPGQRTNGSAEEDAKSALTTSGIPTGRLDRFPPAALHHRISCCSPRSSSRIRQRDRRARRLAWRQRSRPCGRHFNRAPTSDIAAGWSLPCRNYTASA